MRSVVALLLGLLFAIAAVVGYILLGVNVLRWFFDEGGSYTVAITGFALALSGTFLGKIALQFADND